MTKCYLYHIHRGDDMRNLAKGYVGISKNPKRRLVEHKCSNRNLHLKNAFDLYDDIVMTVITEGSRKEMLRLESYLRSDDNIGWNITKGGGDAPDCTGRVWTAEQRKRISERQTGELSWRHGTHLTEEHKQALRERHSGESNHNFGGLKSRRTCEHCNTEDASVHIARWHGDYCKQNPNRKSKPKQAYNTKVVVCTHCKKAGKGANMTRYHFDNCKQKGITNEQ